MRQEAAQKALDDARESVAKWTGHKVAWQDELKAATAQAGDDALKGGDVAKIARKISDYRDRIATCKATIESARRRVVEREKAVVLARAADLETEAADLRKQADRHAVRTNELLAELEAHEDCVYSPAETPRGVPAGQSILPGAPVVVVVNMPLSERLRNQASVLEQQAAGLRANLENAERQAHAAERERLSHEQVTHANQRAELDERMADARRAGLQKVTVAPGVEVDPEIEITPQQEQQILEFERRAAR
jgi:hypothetical protein